MSQPLQTAFFIDRFRARVVDFTLEMLVFFVLPWQLLMLLSVPGADWFGTALLLIAIPIWQAWSTLQRHGQTPGRALSPTALKLVEADGSDIQDTPRNFLRLVARTWVIMLPFFAALPATIVEELSGKDTATVWDSVFVLVLTVALASVVSSWFSKQSLTFHDRLFKTRVIEAPDNQPSFWRGTAKAEKSISQDPS